MTDDLTEGRRHVPWRHPDGAGFTECAADGELWPCVEERARTTGPPDVELTLTRRPSVVVLAEAWDKFWPEIAELIADQSGNKRTRLLGLGLTVGTMVEDLRP